MSSPQPRSVTANAYLVLEPATSSYGVDHEGNKILTGARIVAVKQKRPASLPKNAVAVKVTINIPSGAFLPLVVDAVVDVPESLVVRTAEVTVVDPEEGA